jgi:pyruvate formate lyase activating enzyme
MVLFDIKFIDEALHERYTGKPSAAILENFTRLLGSARVPVVPRVPLVPGVTATRDNLSAVASFLRGRGVSSVRLLEYNPLWLDKAAGIGRPPSYDRRDFMTSEEKDLARSCFAGFDIGRF